MYRGRLDKFFKLLFLISVTPIMFEEDDVMAFFCKTTASQCQFPFVWNGTTYTSCTSDGSEFAWCALEVDSERGVVGRKWGSCDLATCTTDHVEPAQSGDGFSIPMIIIIALVVCIVIILILVGILVICCLRR